ncbi:Ig-like domain-containing protein, partial [Undibacterium luofuense]
NSAVATVSVSGVITPVSAGTVVITATQAAVTGVNAQATQTYTLTVAALPVPVLTFTTPTSASVVMGNNLTNAASSTLSGGSYGMISYSSANSAVATVSVSGVITPVSAGTVVITATQAAVTGVNAQATQTYT